MGQRLQHGERWRHASIQTKDAAKEALIRGPGGIRQLVGIIQKHPQTTNAMRAELGVTIPDTEPSPIAPPSHAPEIDFMPTSTRTIRIRLHNESTFGHGKPPHVVGSTIFSFVGETPPEELSQWKFERNTTRTVIEIDMPASVASGTKVWFSAFWRNAKDQSGPATTPISTVVQYGGLPKAA